MTGIFGWIQDAPLMYIFIGIAVVIYISIKIHEKYFSGGTQEEKKILFTDIITAHMGNKEIRDKYIIARLKEVKQVYRNHTEVIIYANKILKSNSVDNRKYENLINAMLEATGQS